MRIFATGRNFLSAWPMFGAGTPLKLRTRASKSNATCIFTIRNRPPNHDFEGFQEIDLGEIWERFGACPRPNAQPRGRPEDVQETPRDVPETSRRPPGIPTDFKTLQETGKESFPAKLPAEPPAKRTAKTPAKPPASPLKRPRLYTTFFRELNSR